MVSKISGIRLLVIVLFLGLIGLCILSVFLYKSKETTAFIDMKNVFNNFQYKKEMEAKYDKTLMAKKELLDSLRIKIEILSNQQPKDKNQEIQFNNELNGLRQQYAFKQNKFEEENSVLVDKVNSEIWGQLNQYIKDFGLQNKYDYIFGTNGTGNLMYAKDNKDITKEVLNYVNERYQGNAKK